MEIHKNTNKQLNDLLHDARQERPVMNLKDVEKIIADGRYIPAGGSRGLHIGLNNLIVVCGIVVSSFLAYMALKVDQGELGALADSELYAGSSAENDSRQENNANLITGKDEGAISSVAGSSLEPVGAETMNSDLSSASNSSVKSSDRIRAKQNSNTLLASSDPSMVALDNDAAIVEEMPASPKSPSGEYLISFNYNGQDVRMKLVGDEVSELYVDDQEIASGEYSEFDDILSEGKNYLIGRAHSEEGASSLKLIKYFDSMLRADNILTNEEHYKFKLSSSKLLINGQIQSEELCSKYKGLYESRTGKTITPGSVYEFEY